MTGTKCKYCNSSQVRKYGKYKNAQYYWCKSCRRKFTDNGCSFKQRHPENIKQMALQMRQSGGRLLDICSVLSEKFQIKISHTTIEKWTLGMKQ